MLVIRQRAPPALVGQRQHERQRRRRQRIGRGQGTAKYVQFIPSCFFGLGLDLFTGWNILDIIWRLNTELERQRETDRALPEIILHTNCSLCFGLLFWFGVWFGCRLRQNSSINVKIRQKRQQKSNKKTKQKEKRWQLHGGFLLNSSPCKEKSCINWKEGLVRLAIQKRLAITSLILRIQGIFLAKTNTIKGHLANFVRLSKKKILPSCPFQIAFLR